MVRDGWKHSNDPYNVSAPRIQEHRVKRSLEQPIVIIWGSRFSGKTTFLYRILNEVQTRKRFFINSATSCSDRLINEIIKIQNALIVIDSGVLQNEHLRLISRKFDRLKDNNTTVLIAATKMDLNILVNGNLEEAIEIKSHMLHDETQNINRFLNPLGFLRWKQKDKILDNIYEIANSPIISTILDGESTLYDQIKQRCSLENTSKKYKFEFSILFYLAIQQRMFSRIHRVLAKAHSLEFFSDTHIEEFCHTWRPFVEIDCPDPESRRTENSSQLIMCNSYSWIQYAIRNISTNFGIEETATQIVSLYSHIKDIDNDAFKLILFDNLNTIYSPNNSNKSGWEKKVIRLVYKNLASILSQVPDYWLQRAKAIYYISDDEIELRAGIEYCKKGILETDKQTWTNAKLSKANLFGKLCTATNFREDNDLVKAVAAYYDVISDRNENPIYIDELLRKGRHGKGYIRNVCKEAKKRASCLPQKNEIQFIEDYIQNRY